MSGGLSARATRELSAWLAHSDRLTRYELGVLQVLWMATPPRMRRWAPREVEVHLTVPEIEQRSGYATRTVRDAVDGLTQRHGALLRTRSIRDPEKPAWWLPAYAMLHPGHHRSARDECAGVACDAQGAIESLAAAMRWAYGWPRPMLAPRYPDATHPGTRRLVDGITRAHGATLEQWRHVIASAALDTRDNAAIPYRLDLYAIHQRWDRHLARKLEPWEAMPWA